MGGCDVRMFDEHGTQAGQANDHEAEGNLRFEFGEDALGLFAEGPGIEPAVSPAGVGEEAQGGAALLTIEPAFVEFFGEAAGGDGDTVERTYGGADDDIGFDFFCQGLPGSGLISAEHTACGKDQRCFCFPHCLIRLSLMTG